MVKKDFSNNIIREHRDQGLSTLAQDTALVFATKLALAQDFRILKTELWAHFTGALDDEIGLAGLQLGICNGDLDSTFVTECLTSNGPRERNDRDLAEQSSRWVNVVATPELRPYNPNVSGVTQEGRFVGKNGAPMIEFTKPWTYSTTKSWLWFIFNDTGSALGTGISVRLQATHYGVWV